MHPYQHAANSPGKAAYIMASSGLTVTYGELDQRSNRGAHVFRNAGIRTGDAIVLCMTNGARFLEVIWAAQRAGLYYITIPTRLTASEIDYILRDSGARAMICSPSILPIVQEAVRDMPNMLVWTCGGEPDAVGSFEHEVSKYPDTPIADEAPGQDMLYRSTNCSPRCRSSSWPVMTLPSTP